MDPGIRNQVSGAGITERTRRRAAKVVQQTYGRLKQTALLGSVVAHSRPRTLYDTASGKRRQASKAVVMTGTAKMIAFVKGGKRAK